MLDFKTISDLQIRFIEDINDKNMSTGEKISFGKALVANYKKARQIMKSKIAVEGDWEGILTVSKSGLQNIVESLEGDAYHTEDLTARQLISYVDFLMAVQFLDFEDELHFKHVEGGLEDEINIDLFDDV